MHGEEHLQCQAEIAENWSDLDAAIILYKDQQKSSTNTLMISHNSYTNCDDDAQKNCKQEGPTDQKNQTQIKPRNGAE